jgi:hypothetical protein
MGRCDGSLWPVVGLCLVPSALEQAIHELIAA